MYTVNRGSSTLVVYSHILVGGSNLQRNHEEMVRGTDLCMPTVSVCKHTSKYFR